jgi:polyhydroxyalkanoic acid synthase PhaR subunit
MSQNNGPDFSDPFGAWRSLRDANLDALAKSMATMVNTDAFSKAIGMQLDSYLAVSAPFQKAVEQYMEAYLAQLRMPSRSELISMAQRLTNIELRIDDMDARLDEILEAVGQREPAPAQPAAALDDKLATLEGRLAQIVKLLEQQPVAPAPAASEPPAPTRSRRNRATTEEGKQ